MKPRETVVVVQVGIPEARNPQLEFAISVVFGWDSYRVQCGRNDTRSAASLPPYHLPETLLEHPLVARALELEQRRHRHPRRMHEILHLEFRPVGVLGQLGR